MKKFLSLTVIALIALIALTTNVSAAEVSSQAEFETALAGTDTEITLTKNVELSKSLEIGRMVILDLNGFNITAADGMTDDSLIIVLHGGTLIIEGNGSVSAKNSNASARIAVKMTKAGCDISKKAELVLNSGTLEGTSFGISGNGNPDRINTSITISGGTVKGDTTGIYHPQEGTLTITGGTVKGSTGIEMRSGSLIVYDGTIIGTGAPTDVTANGNGTTTDGAGIAVAQHTTEKNIDVTVIGGNVQGYSAVYESNPQSNDAIDKVTMKIEGGNFEAINGGKLAIYSEDKKDFISGGTFSTDVSDYVDTDKLDVVEDEDGNIYVGTLHTITVEKSENGKVEVDKSTAVAGQKISVKVTPDEGYKLSTIAISYPRMGGATPGDDFEGYFIMENDDCVVVAKFEKIEEPSEGGQGTAEKEPEKDPEKDETPKTGAFDIALYVLGAIALVSVVGTVKAKKPGKYSK